MDVDSRKPWRRRSATNLSFSNEENDGTSARPNRSARASKSAAAGDGDDAIGSPGVEVVRIEASPPAVEGLAANAEVAASQSRIPFPCAVEIPPGQPNLGFPAQLLHRARPLAGTGSKMASFIHSLDHADVALDFGRGRVRKRRSDTAPSFMLACDLAFKNASQTCACEN